MLYPIEDRVAIFLAITAILCMIDMFINGAINGKLIIYNWYICSEHASIRAIYGELWMIDTANNRRINIYLTASKYYGRSKQYN